MYARKKNIRIEAKENSGFLEKFDDVKIKALPYQLPKSTNLENL